MAVIKNKKTGMWEVRTYYKDLTGERKQKTKRGFAKKSEALEWERNFKLKENQSISMNFQSFADGYGSTIGNRKGGASQCQKRIEMIKTDGVM